MTALRVLCRRIAALFRRRALERQLEEEFRLHLEMLTEDNLRKGMAPHDARSAARRSFGNVENTKEIYRDTRSLPAVEMLLQDIRYGLRLLRKSPGFTAVAILSLALGIGANCAIFSLVNAVLLKDLPVREPERLAVVRAFEKNAGRDLSYPVFRDVASRQQVFTEMAASGGLGITRVSLGGNRELLDPTAIDASLVSANYFTMLGVRAAAGRVFTTEDSRAPGEGAVAVISHRFWQRHFGADPSVPGQTIVLNGMPFTIVGVAARGFFGDRVGTARDLWIPILMQPRVSGRNLLEARTATWFRTIGRLKAGVTDSQANAELTGLFQQLKAQEIATGSGSLISSGTMGDHRCHIERGSSGLNVLQRQFRKPLGILMAAVGLVLLIACCNLANLLLARAAARRKEIGIRLALGSSRRRLAGQLLTESILLALSGGAAGLALAQFGSRLMPAQLSLVLDVSPDARVFAFALGVSLLSAVLFGLAPAIQATSLNLNPTLHSSSAGLSASRPRQRLSRALVISQVALSLWLLAGAGLLVRSLRNLRDLDIGMNRGNVLLVGIKAARPVKAAEAAGLRRQLQERLEALPGVSSVSLSGYGLFTRSGTSAPVRVPGSSVNPENDGDVRENWISPEYFQTFGMKLLAGRVFTGRDSEAAAKVGIINETTARHYFGKENPVGRMIYFPGVDAQGRYIPFGSRLDKAQGVQIVGVVRDAKFDSLREPVARMVYLPIAQGDSLAGSIEIRTAGDPAVLAPLVRQVLKDADRDILLRSVGTLEDQIDRTLVEERLFAKLLGFFAVLALVLACVGLYGLMSYAVVRRTAEIGIRMALGAARSDVVFAVVGETLLLSAAGVAFGIPAALASTHLLEKLLFGLTPTDPLTLGAVSLTMVAVAVLAAAIPARRASRIDPMVALRYD